MKGYKYKKKKYDTKLESQTYNNFKPITEKDMYMGMAEILVMAQMIKSKREKAGDK